MKTAPCASSPATSPPYHDSICKFPPKALGRIVEGMFMIFKNPDTRLISTNGELSCFLSGENPEKLNYLSPDLPVFDPEMTLVDHWGCPDLVHIIEQGSLECGWQAL